VTATLIALWCYDQRKTFLLVSLPLPPILCSDVVQQHASPLKSLQHIAAQSSKLVVDQHFGRLQHRVHQTPFHTTTSEEILLEQILRYWRSKQRLAIFGFVVSLAVIYACWNRLLPAMQ
jgi:hypothetical protein